MNIRSAIWGCSALCLALLVTGCGDSGTTVNATVQSAESRPAIDATLRAGNGEDLYKLAMAYEFGDEDGDQPDNIKPFIIAGIHKDQAEAKKLVLLSAGKGFALSQVRMSTDTFFAGDYTQCVFWAKKAAAQGNKNAAELLGTMKTVVQSDPLGTYTPEKRSQMAQALGADIDSIQAYVLPTPAKN